jgi:hypothetical protein
VYKSRTDCNFCFADSKEPELPNAQQNFEIGNQEKIQYPKLNFIVQETLNVLNPLPDLKGKYHKKYVFTLKFTLHSTLSTAEVCDFFTEREFNC